MLLLRLDLQLRSQYGVGEGSSCMQVQANAKPPVCKLMDYNKEKYKQKMKEKEHKGKVW